MREVARIAFPSRVPESARFVTVFTTYLDASRDEGDSGVHTLAGFVSDAQRWEVFDREWQAVLDCYEITGGGFHMTDFESGYGEFKDWPPDDPRRVLLLEKLLAVIERNTVASVGYGVPKAMFDAVVPPDVLEVVGGSSYFFLFLNLLINAESLMDAAARFEPVVPYDWRMAYLLARGDPGSGPVMNLWMSKNRAVVSTRIETRTTGVFIATNNAEYLPLQAADILAFEGRKQIGLHLGLHDRPERQLFAALSQSRRPSSWHFIQHEHHLRALSDTVKREVLGAAS